MNKLIKVSVITTQVAAAVIYIAIINVGGRAIVSRFNDADIMSTLKTLIMVGFLLQAVSSLLHYRFTRVTDETTDQLQQIKKGYSWIALLIFFIAAVIVTYFVYNG